MARTKPTEGNVTVKVTGQPIFEAGERYEKGASFETTAERAEALGELVEVTGAAPAKEAPAA